PVPSHQCFKAPFRAVGRELFQHPPIGPPVRLLARDDAANVPENDARLCRCHGRSPRQVPVGQAFEPDLPIGQARKPDLRNRAWNLARTFKFLRRETRFLQETWFLVYFTVMSNSKVLPAST